MAAIVAIALAQQDCPFPSTDNIAVPLGGSAWSDHPNSAPVHIRAPAVGVAVRTTKASN